jgi:hypothetical protein
MNPDILLALERVIVRDTPARKIKVPAVTLGNHHQKP